MRGRDGLTPTVMADQLFERFSRALGWIDSTLQSKEHFDPLQSTRRFQLAMSDLGVLSFANPLLRRFQACAPGIEIDIEKIDDRIGDAMAAGRVDAVIGNQPHPRRADRILSQGWKPTLRWSPVDKCSCRPVSLTSLVSY